MRTLDELKAVTDPAWPLVRGWIAGATNRVEALPPSEPQRGAALHATQVTLRSTLGAVIYETGGLLLDHGWLRILGSGHPRLPRSLPEWNRGRTVTREDQPPPLLLVADDVVGGFFAMNGGAFDSKPGTVHYFAPDSLAWESLDAGYSDFLHWCLTGDLARFYEAHRWPGWEQEVAGLSGDRGISIYPFLWAEGPPVAQRHRGSVPMAELYGLQMEWAAKL